MEFVQAKKAVEAKRAGTIRTICYTKLLKTRTGVRDLITKTTHMQVRFGVKYDNMRAVMDARNTCALPVKNQGLSSNLVWLDKNFIQNKVTGDVMLRVAYANGHKTKTVYYKNGIEVDKKDIAPLCLKSETETRATAPTVFNIKVDKIVSID